MKILKNNIKEFGIWIAYFIGILFIEKPSIFLIYTVTLIAIRLISNTHKLFNSTVADSEKIKKDQNYLRLAYFISFAIIGIFIKANKSDNPICFICGVVFILTGLFIVIFEVIYLIQRKIENKVLEKQIKFEQKYDQGIFNGVLYIVTNIDDFALIRKLAYIISNYRIGSYNSYFIDIQDMMERLKKENYIIEEDISMERGNVDILCYRVNKLLDNFNIDFKITPEMIYKTDNEKVVNCRRESMSTIINDVNIINNYLKDFNYEIVVFMNDEKLYFALLHEKQKCEIEELYKNNIYC